MSISMDTLRSLILERGTENRVTVNQRLLIDKMLARYSSDFVIFRELIQNSDDACATYVHLEFTCTLAKNEPNVKTVTQKTSSVKQETSGTQNENSFWKKKPKITANFEANQMSRSPKYAAPSDSVWDTETNFHNSTITEIRTINDGKIFNETDWKRVASIAEGNLNVESVGQFGVGFFSVFSLSEEPIIISGKECMVFVWRNDDSLTTYRHELPVEQQSNLTSIILKMRNEFVLHVESPRAVGNHPKSKENNGKSTIKNQTMTTIIPTIDLIQLKGYLIKVLSFTKHINELLIKVNGKIVFQASKTMKLGRSTEATSSFKLRSIHNMFTLDSFEHIKQEISIGKGPPIALRHIAVHAKLTVDEQFHAKIRQILKKSLPSTIQIQLILAPNHMIKQQQLSQSTTDTNSQHDFYTKMLDKLSPLKIENGEIIPSGYIFIGQGTHQTTGVGMHAYSHFIPTIERENLDLQDPYIAQWNNELLAAVGQIARFVYDQAMIAAVNNLEKHRASTDLLSTIIAPYSFQSSVPNPQISSTILQGFFHSNTDILVPVRQSPSDSSLKLIPSKKAYLTYSKHIYAFLSLPLVPLELAHRELFTHLKKSGLIIEVNNALIKQTLLTTILLETELIELLNWLSENNINNKQQIDEMFSFIRFRQTALSSVVTLKQIKYFDGLNVSPLLPLPINVLPAYIADHFSREKLSKRLFLTAIAFEDLLEFYMHKDQQHLFLNEKTAPSLLSLICEYSDILNEAYRNKIKKALFDMKCIPTTQGMKKPNDSYIPSSTISNNQATIILTIRQTKTRSEKSNENVDQSVTLDFLNQLGCRMLNLKSILNTQTANTNNPLTSSSSDSLRILIQQLMDERKKMTDTDFNTLKGSRFLAGTTLTGSKEATRTYIPYELCFPSVAIRLNWSTLPILDWRDIDPQSLEYGFLREIGVQEVPSLDQLLDRIVLEHGKQQVKTKKEYKLPEALHFFAENFVQHYSSLLKTSSIKRTFLPSYYSTKSLSHDDDKSDNTVVLSSPEEVYIVPGPLCATLLPNVIELFKDYFSTLLIGVKNSPTLSVAFNQLIKRKDELLASLSSASEIFAYMNTLEGLNRTLIESISKFAFIPLQGTNTLYTPSQVFIRASESKAVRKRDEKNKNPLVKSSPSNDTDNIDQSGLIDYVDFGPNGNSFLLAVGVVHYPTAAVLAGLLIDRQAYYFQNSKHPSTDKLRVYTTCLKQLAAMSHELQSNSIVTRMRNEAWCLGYQMVDHQGDEKERTFTIATPREVYLDDNHQYTINLKPLCAPDEPDLTKLYGKFGSTWLSESVQRTLRHSGKPITSERSKLLRSLIHGRLDLLFVNNRGDKMANLDEKRVELIRNNLAVYEVDAIECHLIFQRRSYMFDSSNSSSCTLEYKDYDLALYFEKNLRDLDYFEIASELAQFVFKKGFDTANVHIICDRLSSSLEMLRRRGVPVDRLLKDTHHDQEMYIAKQQKRPQQPEKTQQSQTKLDQMKSKHLQVLKQAAEIRDFRQGHEEKNNKLHTAIGKAKSFTQTTLVSRERFTIEPTIATSMFCDPHYGFNLTRSSHVFHSIPFFIEKNMTIPTTMVEQAQQLALIINGLATHVFEMNIKMIHLFRDTKGPVIAFNQNGSIFYNLRYFEQIFADNLKQSLQTTSSDSIVDEIINFYFIVTCHELAHNIEHIHNATFVRYLEDLAVKFMSKKERFLQQFSFNS